MLWCRSGSTSGGIWPKPLLRPGLILKWGLGLNFSHVVYGLFLLSLEHPPKKEIPWPPWTIAFSISNWNFSSLKPVAIILLMANSGLLWDVPVAEVSGSSPLTPLFWRGPSMPHTSEYRMTVSNFFWVRVSKPTICKPPSPKYQAAQSTALNLWAPKSV